MADSRITVSEESSGVRVPGIWELIFSDGTVTPDKGGKVHIQSGGGGGSADVVQTTKNAGTAIGGHRAVKVVAGLLQYASKDDNPSAESVYGITINAGNIGDPIDVVLSGEIQEASWSWTQNLPIYLSTSGQLTQTAPTTGAVVELGIAVTSDTMLVRIQKTMFLA